MLVAMVMLMIAACAPDESADGPGESAQPGTAGERAEADTQAADPMSARDDSLDRQSTAGSDSASGDSALHATAGDSAAEISDVSESAAGDSIMGRVEVTGSTPMTQVVLQVDEGPALRLVGELEGELRRLSGILVAVSGEPTSEYPGNAMRVEGYRIVSVDGRPVHVGVLVEEDGEIALVGDEERYRITVPGSLSERVGAKVWIAGEVNDDVLRVQTYGVIRPG